MMNDVHMYNSQSIEIVIFQADAVDDDPLGVDVKLCAFFTDSEECLEIDALRLLNVPTFNLAISSNLVMLDNS